MGIDQNEARRQRQVDRPKTSTKHPYAATEWRVIDSPAYADLTFSARSLLVLLTRQLTKGNNGHLQATHSYLQGFGFSENTISRCVKELIAHGMIYRTRSGGFHQGAAQYAVTWLSITNRQDIFVDGFQPCAWRNWQHKDKKTPPPNLRTDSRKNGEWTTSTTPKFTASPPPKSGDIELMPCRGIIAESDRLQSYLDKLEAARLGNGQHAGRVQAHLEARRA
ncbi:MAG: hypothetical protein WC100_17055 [Sterolibacterium sp.]